MRKIFILLALVAVCAAPSFAARPFMAPDVSGSISTHNSSAAAHTSGFDLVTTYDVDMNQARRPATSLSPAVLAEAGNLNGTYVYRVSFITADGETEASPASSGISPANQQAILSSIPTSSDSYVTGRKIYRGADYLSTKYIATIADNTTTTYVDNIADAAYGSSPIFYNTTGGGLYLKNHAGTYQIFNAGYESVTLGFAAGGQNFGPGNTAIGPYAGDDLTTGYWNTILGYEAGANITSGDSNTFGGLKSGYLTTTGRYNTGWGLDSVNQNTTGNGNTGVGYHGLYWNSTGNYNAAFGWYAGEGVSGQNPAANVYFGAMAGRTNVGSANVLIGYESGKAGTGGNNVMIGHSAGLDVTDAEKSVFVGTNAGGNTTSGDNNVYVGQNAGYTATTASNNVLIGYYAGWKETGSNTLIIDSQIRADEATSRTNAILYGIMAAAPANQTLTFNAAIINMPYLPTYADNAAAITGGLAAGRVYKTSTGVLMVVYTP